MAKKQNEPSVVEQMFSAVIWMFELLPAWAGLVAVALAYEMNRLTGGSSLVGGVVAGAVLLAWLLARARVLSNRVNRDRMFTDMNEEWRRASRSSQAPVLAPVSPPSPRCPRCESVMVRRIAQKGVNAGSQFWGCPHFPKCWGTRPHLPGR